MTATKAALLLLGFLALAASAAEPLIGIGLYGHVADPRQLEFILWEIDYGSGVATKTRLNETVSCSSFGKDYMGAGGTNCAAATVLPAGVVQGMGRALVFLAQCYHVLDSKAIMTPPIVIAMDLDTRSVRKVAETPRSAFTYDGFTGYNLAYDQPRKRLVVAGPNPSSPAGGSPWKMAYVSIDPATGKLDADVHSGPPWDPGEW
jgi:hypothetical protein